MKTLFIVLFCLGSLACQSQADLREFLNTSGQQEVSLPTLNHLENLITNLKASGQSEKGKLHKAFQKLHRSYLKKYVAYASFNDMFTSGEFDCLTGTALFSYVLDRLGYRYEVIETNYHIFLIVHAGTDEILLETTDRFGGFVTDRDEIASRTQDYRDHSPPSNRSGSFQYRYTFQLYQVITANQITGLLFFNQAVKAFNNHDWVNSARQLHKAMSYYPSTRCQELNNLLERTMLSAQINSEKSFR